MMFGKTRLFVSNVGRLFGQLETCIMRLDERFSWNWNCYCRLDLLESHCFLPKHIDE